MADQSAPGHYDHVVQPGNVQPNELFVLADPRFHEGREVKDSIDVVHPAADRFGTGHIADRSLQIRVLGKAIPLRLEDQRTDLPSAIQQASHDAATDEAGASRYERPQGHRGPKDSRG